MQQVQDKLDKGGADIEHLKAKLRDLENQRVQLTLENPILANLTNSVSKLTESNINLSKETNRLWDEIDAFRNLNGQRNYLNGVSGDHANCMTRRAKRSSCRCRRPGTAACGTRSWERARRSRMTT
mgnify:CR=1 FL=1